MSIKTAAELEGMKKVSEAVASTLLQMRNYAKPGISTRMLDEFGGKILKQFGAKSAPYETYGFPGWTCISVNNEVAHGIPSTKRILKEGDLINIDVSAELNGFWADNGGSFVLGEDIHNHLPLVEASKKVLHNAIINIKDGTPIAEIGAIIQNEANRAGFKVLKNLAGHGVGRSLHEEPEDILNYPDRRNKKKFKKDDVVAIETFISTKSTQAVELKDGWTLVGNRGGYVAQHEHTIVVTDRNPIILTEGNDIFNY
ncbi:type I methionyl aminopeptidase [Reichenbachiella ulvae]|uniref:Methionine aminopeptidase n=1 Tax=Reichenbachiella ulvae TaxID=2980104 RepID=A0ABT3CPZ9_9BACT|nr:type I methionyl aminopeptidase [Reichenbachiella ulvae]MCV9385348.1 type I methionyl aminopeptidase [Reichenbachiella ulvae]